MTESTPDTSASTTAAAPAKKTTTKHTKRREKPLPDILVGLNLASLTDYQVITVKETAYNLDVTSSTNSTSHNQDNNNNPKKNGNIPKNDTPAKATSTATITATLNTSRELDHAVFIVYKKGPATVASSVDLKALTVDQLRRIASHLAIKRMNLTKQMARYWIAERAKEAGVATSDLSAIPQQLPTLQKEDEEAAAATTVAAMAQTPGDATTRAAAPATTTITTTTAKNPWTATAVTTALEEITTAASSNLRGRSSSAKNTTSPNTQATIQQQQQQQPPPKELPAPPPPNEPSTAVAAAAAAAAATAAALEVAQGTATTKSFLRPILLDHITKPPNMTSPTHTQTQTHTIQPPTEPRAQYPSQYFHFPQQRDNDGPFLSRPLLGMVPSSRSSPPRVMHAMITLLDAPSPVEWDSRSRPPAQQQQQHHQQQQQSLYPQPAATLVDSRTGRWMEDAEALPHPEHCYHDDDDNDDDDDDNNDNNDQKTNNHKKHPLIHDDTTTTNETAVATTAAATIVAQTDAKANYLESLVVSELQKHYLNYKKMLASEHRPHKRKRMERKLREVEVKLGIADSEEEDDNDE